MLLSNDKQWTVSVVIPAYNAGRFIKEAIESVINQTYENWELLIVDDGSTDNTLEIADLYRARDSRIKVFRLEHNSGSCGVPRNHALRYARGKYIAFLDADDLWVKNKLEVQMNIMVNNSAVDMTYGLARKMNNYILLNSPLHWVPSSHTLKYTNPIPLLTVMLRREVFLKTQPFTENLTYRGFEDWELWQRLTKLNCRVYFIRKTLAFYRMSEKSVSTERDFKLKDKQLLQTPIPLYYRFFQNFVIRPFKLFDLIWISIKNILIKVSKNERFSN